MATGRDVSSQFPQATLGGQKYDIRPLPIIQARAWQYAKPLGSYALCGCTVAPGFEFSELQIAPAGWSPPSHF